MASLVYESDEIRCLLVSDVLIFVATHSGNPSDAAWEGYLQVARGLVAGLTGLLVVAGDTTITPKQRVSLRTVFGNTPVRIAVLTNSLLARGVLTAISWFGIRIAGFAMGEYESALRWIGREELAGVIEGHVRDVFARARRRAV
jgi:hypothetical protein